MAEFNLNSFLNEQASYNSRQYTAIENGKAAMEARDIERAEKAVSENSFLGITMSQKFAELGVGHRVVQQLSNTAIGVVENVITPFAQWLEEYEHIYDESLYNAEMQTMGKQMFFAKQALTFEASTAKQGQNFVYMM